MYVFFNKIILILKFTLQEIPVLSSYFKNLATKKDPGWQIKDKGNLFF